MPYAIVTGATHGIGRAIAERFLSEGFSIIVCARNGDELIDLRDTWTMQWPQAEVLTYKADVGNREDLAAFVEFVVEKAETIDVLVNNAGIFLQGDLANEPEGQLEELMNVNLYSAYRLTRALLPKMIERKCGHIFNMCSVASLKAYPGGGAYSITKYALLGFSENLRQELKPYGVKVTAICPGATWSRSWSESGVEKSRVMEAEDVAKMAWASYTLSPQANVEMIVVRPQLGDI